MIVSGRAVSEESARCILHEPMIPCHDTTLCQDSDARGVAVACDACDSQLLPTTSFSRPFSPSRFFRSKSCPPADFGPYPAKRSSRTQENNFSGVISLGPDRGAFLPKTRDTREKEKTGRSTSTSPRAKARLGRASCRGGVRRRAREPLLTAAPSPALTSRAPPPPPPILSSWDSSLLDRSRGSRGGDPSW